jgi:hypothetical protein
VFAFASLATLESLGLIAQILILLVYVVACSFFLFVVLGIMHFAKEKSETILAKLKSFMIVHNDEIVVASFLLFGVYLILRGLDQVGWMV